MSIMTKLKFKSNIFEFSNKSIFYKFFYKNFFINFFIYVKISKNLSAKYQQENKERLQKKARKRYQKKKSKNMVVNFTEISQKMKKLNWLSIEENIIEYEKIPYCNYREAFCFKKFVSL